jgi:transposase-like protein
VTSAVTIDDDQDHYSGYRFPPEIIQQAIWLYVRFTLSFRDVEDLLPEREILVSYETVRRWVNHFGPKIAADLRKRRPKLHTIWHLDEVYLKIDGRLVYLWRAVDAEGEVLNVLVQTRLTSAISSSVISTTCAPNWRTGVPSSPIESIASRASRL